MRKSFFTLFALLALCVHAQQTLTVDTKHPGSDISPTMYGIFFEDINFGADGGLYAELVANRSFEAPMHKMGDKTMSGGLLGWTPFGNVSVSDVRPAFSENPHYVVLADSGHIEKRTGIENRGYFGMGVKKGQSYTFSTHARLHEAGGKKATLRVELVNTSNDIIARKTINVTSTDWKRYTVSMTPSETEAKALLRIFLQTADGADLDHVSLMPDDNWHGMRTDLVGALKDLHPGVFRFPGGCIVEGTDLATRYQWKKSVGDVENREMNENRWNYTFAHRMSPLYYQSLGIGFYEYFLLSEYIGAEPLPILSCGMACQFQNPADDPKALVALDALDEYIQDALDLIEFANGDTSTKWGAVRAAMGHPAPFNMKYIGIGNEQWGPRYPERLELFLKVIRAKYPKMQVVGTSGPSPDGEDFDYGWNEMRRLKADLVDEHYYRSPEWFLQNVTRYDSYSRKGPKVFAGEYACHTDGQRNNFQAALCEAAFMTGLERNADLVRMATYAPLFAHVEGWQWRPDLIWFDNLRHVRSANYQVQQLYSLNRGTRVVPLTGAADGVYASAAWDDATQEYIVKMVNTTGTAKQDVSVVLKGKKNIANVTGTLLTAPSLTTENTLDNPNAVKPVALNASAWQTDGNRISMTLGANSFVILRVKAGK